MVMSSRWWLTFKLFDATDRPQEEEGKKIETHVLSTKIPLR